MQPFVRVKKAANQQPLDEKETYRIAVLGDCATQHFSTALLGCAAQKTLSLSVLDTDYNQIDAQLMDANSELYRFEPNCVVLLMCTEKLYETFLRLPIDQRSEFAEVFLKRILNYWQQISAMKNCSLYMFTFRYEQEGVFGNYASKVEGSFQYQLRKLNYLLIENGLHASNVQMLDFNEITQRYGYDHAVDDALYYTSKLPLALDYLSDMATMVIDCIAAKLGNIKKCIVLDLDNTLWGGVIGDDGINGIQIGELGLGHAFVALQIWLKELKNRGILLAVCSKNDEDVAKEPFIKHPEMILRLDDFAMFVANWENKAKNIAVIAQTLNLGLDSFVFIDDNPFERHQVATALPQVCVPALPEDPSQYLRALKALNLFETASYSCSDLDRTAQYQANAKLHQVQAQFDNYDEYLASLNMVSVCEPFTPFYYARIAQLTQRSNQFNLRTVRYQESDISNMAESPEYLTLYFTLKDKIADHGLISVVIMKPLDVETLFIDTWLMSCRVLKRGMEEFVINHILRTAKEHGYHRVVGEYLKTIKNSMVEHIYPNMGFTPIGDTRYVVDVSNFIERSTNIEEVQL